MEYFLVIETYERWLVDKRKGLRERVFSARLGKTLYAMNPGDRIVIYIASRISSFAAICELISTPEKCSLSFDEITSWDGVFSIKMLTEPVYTLEEREFIDCRPLIPKLDFIPKHKKWGCALQGSLRKISKKDYEVIEREFIKIKGR